MEQAVLDINESDTTEAPEQIVELSLDDLAKVGGGSMGVIFT
jgi:hypothetical protein